METNGKASLSKRTKHINIRYYFITDRINKKELSVEWCPTGDMIGNCMTKPLQGTPFKTFRDEIMGVVLPRKPGKGKVKTEDSVVRSSKDRRTSSTEKKKKKHSLVQCKQKERAQAHRSVLEQKHSDKQKKVPVEGQTRQPSGRSMSSTLL